MSNVLFSGVVLSLQLVPCFGYTEVKLDVKGKTITLQLSPEQYNALYPLTLGSNINFALSKGERIP